MKSCRKNPIVHLFNHWRLALLVFLLSCLLWVALRPAVAQTGDYDSVTWQEPVKLYTSDASVEFPIILADDAGRLHLFWNEVVMSTDGLSQSARLFYMLQENGTWSEPVDVLLRGDGRMDFPRSVIDKYGRLYVVYGGAQEPLGFSQTDSADAGSAQAWDKATNLTDFGQLGGNIGLAPDGSVHVVYAGLSGDIQHIMRPLDEPWGDSQSVYTLPTGKAVSSDGPLFAVDNQGGLHVAWSEGKMPLRYPSTGSFYSYSADDGETWTQPISIAPVDQQIFSLLVAENGRIHLFYAGRVGVGGRYHRWSDDNGRSWSDPQAIASPTEGTGLSGGDLALDERGKLHAVMGLDGDEIIGYSQWDGTLWNDWVNISADLPGIKERMSVELVAGNRLFVTWESDHDSIWYVEGQLGSPPTPPQDFIPLPTVVPKPEPTAVLADLTPVATDLPDIPRGQPATTSQRTVIEALGIGFLAVTGLVGMVFVVQERKRRF
ncbi:MAG: exo-alpha-sialidase [Anaerolineales bacterium]|nr:exo-alpha-sialidase [Anaerolineales bacterium]